jgi:hypothetical protein
MHVAMDTECRRSRRDASHAAVGAVGQLEGLPGCDRGVGNRDDQPERSASSRLFEHFPHDVRSERIGVQVDRLRLVGDGPAPLRQRCNTRTASGGISMPTCVPGVGTVIAPSFATTTCNSWPDTSTRIWEVNTRDDSHHLVSASRGQEAVAPESFEERDHPLRVMQFVRAGHVVVIQAVARSRRIR